MSEEQTVPQEQLDYSFDMMIGTFNRAMSALRILTSTHVELSVVDRETLARHAILISELGNFMMETLGLPNLDAAREAVREALDKQAVKDLAEPKDREWVEIAGQELLSIEYVKYLESMEEEARIQQMDLFRRLGVAKTRKNSKAVSKIQKNIAELNGQRVGLRMALTRFQELRLK